MGSLSLRRFCVKHYHGSSGTHSAAGTCDFGFLAGGEWDLVVVNLFVQHDTFQRGFITQLFLDTGFPYDAREQLSGQRFASVCRPGRYQCGHFVRSYFDSNGCITAFSDRKRTAFAFNHAGKETFYCVVGKIQLGIFARLATIPFTQRQ